MNNRLSHSQINKHIFCQTAWKNHYVLGLRPVELSSALPFGSAFGKACEFILNPGIHRPDDMPESCLSSKQVFDYYWNFQDINGELKNIKEYPFMAYSKYDIDYDLITKEQQTENPSWWSLRAKAHLMLETFQNELLPLIEHVYSTEEKIELENDQGDSSIGFADCVVKLEGYSKPVILDFKTAAREYEYDSVRKSVQLSQYLHVLSEKYENTRLAGYAVFLKQIEKNRVKTCKSCGHVATGSHKTCENDRDSIAVNGQVVKKIRCGGEWNQVLNPKAKMQLIVDEIPLATEEFIIGNIENINDSIKSGVFTKNVNGCFDNGWGRPCEYQKYCREGKMDGIIKVEKKI